MLRWRNHQPFLSPVQRASSIIIIPNASVQLLTSAIPNAFRSCFFIKIFLRFCVSLATQVLSMDISPRSPRGTRDPATAMPDPSDNIVVDDRSRSSNLQLNSDKATDDDARDAYRPSEPRATAITESAINFSDSLNHQPSPDKVLPESQEASPTGGGPESHTMHFTPVDDSLNGGSFRDYEGASQSQLERPSLSDSVGLKPGAKNATNTSIPSRSGNARGNGSKGTSSGSPYSAAILTASRRLHGEVQEFAHSLCDVGRSRPIMSSANCAPGANAEPPPVPVSTFREFLTATDDIEELRNVALTLYELVEKHRRDMICGSPGQHSRDAPRSAFSSTPTTLPSNSSSSTSHGFANAASRHTSSEFPVFVSPSRLPSNRVSWADFPKGMTLPLASSSRQSLIPANESVVSMYGLTAVHEFSATFTTNDDGSVVLGEYEVVTEIGSGSFGQVYLAVDCSSDQPVAIKSMPRTIAKKWNPQALSPTFTSTVLDDIVDVASTLPTHEGIDTASAGAQHGTVHYEIAVMKRLRHKNLVRLYAVIEDEVEEQVHLVMQYVENGPIAKIKDGMCTPLPIADVIHYMVQVSAGLSYLHKHNILHRDVKPENILVDRHRNAYVADFGVSSVTEDRGAHPRTPTVCGTIAFLSPEVISSNDAILLYGKEADTWAFGVSLYLLVYGKLPFSGWNSATCIKSILHDEPQFPTHSPRGEQVPPQLLHAIKHLLAKKPDQRMRLQSFRKAMVHVGRSSVAAVEIPRQSLDSASSNPLSLSPQEEGCDDDEVVIHPLEAKHSVLRPSLGFVSRTRTASNSSVNAPEETSSAHRPSVFPPASPLTTSSNGFVQRLRGRLSLTLTPAQASTLAVDSSAASACDSDANLEASL